MGYKFDLRWYGLICYKLCNELSIPFYVSTRPVIIVRATSYYCTYIQNGIHEKGVHRWRTIKNDFMPIEYKTYDLG